MIDLSFLKSHLNGKPLAIVGLGKTGLAVMQACEAAGISVCCWDDHPDARALAGDRVENLTEADFSRFGLLCLSPGLPLTHPQPHPCVVRAKEAGVEIVCDVELLHRACPQNKTIAITGTNGKSTTTALIGHILSQAGVDCAVGGNIGTAALSLPQLSAEGVYVLELSSYQIDLCPTFHPTVAVLLNFSPDHLDRHGGMAGYVAAKENLFKGTGVGVIGIDDEQAKALCARVQSAGERHVFAVSATETGMTINGEKVADAITQGPALRGLHNAQNALAAYAACRAVGLEDQKIIEGINTFPGLRHRQNKVAQIGTVTYINDSKATNDQASAMALRTFAPIYWIAGGLAKEGGYADCEKYLDNVRQAYLIGKAQDAMAQWLDSKRVPYVRCETLDRALACAHADAQNESLENAVVLLSPACASWDQFKSFEHRGDAFVEMVEALAVEGKKTACN